MRTTPYRFPGPSEDTSARAVPHRRAESGMAAVSRAPPRAPVRALQVIELLAETREPLSLSTLSSRLGLPKTSAMHLLRALEAGAYVQRTHAGFQLATASYRFASKIGVTNSFEEAARPVLQAMVERAQETILLGTFTEDRRAAVYTMQFPSPRAVRFAPEAGDERPLYATGVGKLLLAYAPSAFVENYLRDLQMRSITAKTVATKKALREQLRRIRQAGMAVSIDEMAEGGSALAAPIADRDGRVDVALVIAVPTSRLAAHRELLESTLLDGAAKVSGLLPYVAMQRLSANPSQAAEAKARRRSRTVAPRHLAPRVRDPGR